MVQGVLIDTAGIIFWEHFEVCSELSLGDCMIPIIVSEGTGAAARIVGGSMLSSELSSIRESEEFFAANSEVEMRIHRSRLNVSFDPEDVIARNAVVDVKPVRPIITRNQLHMQRSVLSSSWS